VSGPLDFNHARDRRSLKHRYAEAEAEIREIAIAALQNERLTRGRIEVIEALLGRSLWGRLTWLLRGK